MKAHGVPASITLAQGMLESGFGSSYIAVMGNNHFGIKSYRAKEWGWAGRSLSCDDDTKDEPFCSFGSVPEGYEYHSKFLTSNSRYAKLFKLDIQDYKGWAQGLQDCGYATSKTYAKNLIDLIERYHLDTFDVYDGKLAYNLTKHKLYKTSNKGGLPYVLCLSNDDLPAIATEYGISMKKLRKWNDLSETSQLQEGDIVYLHRKKTRALKQYKTHVVKEGDSLWKISQTYGVTVACLMHRNKLKTARLELGQTLKLR